MAAGPSARKGRRTRAEAVAGRLHSAAIHLLRRLRVRDAELGLTGPAASALSVVVVAGPMTLGALAAAEQVRPPTITRLVQQMEAAGLVARRADRRDGRVQVIRATARGRRLLAEGRARRVAALTASLVALPPEDLRALESAVAILEGVVGAPGEGLRARAARRTVPA
jgi:DNA-binding MarR family transcriptional regulator